jgi:hypothetical protein
MKSVYEILLKTSEGYTANRIEFDEETKLLEGNKFMDAQTKIVTSGCADKRTLAVFSNEISIIKIK